MEGGQHEIVGEAASCSVPSGANEQEWNGVAYSAVQRTEG